MKDSSPKCDQQFLINHQEHNRNWKVWIGVMRLCYEMCHVLQCYVFSSGTLLLDQRPPRYTVYLCFALRHSPFVKENPAKVIHHTLLFVVRFVLPVCSVSPDTLCICQDRSGPSFCVMVNGSHILRANCSMPKRCSQLPVKAFCATNSLHFEAVTSCSP